MAKTIVWNGPMGYFEDKKFAIGTDKIALAILQSKATSVIGGGETGERIVKLLNCKIVKKPENVFISTGGGAMLEYLGGKDLPGLRKILSK
jgi:phosphoglycerate kinase